MQSLFLGMLTLLTIFSTQNAFAKHHDIPPCNNETLAEAWGETDEEAKAQKNPY